MSCPTLSRLNRIAFVSYDHSGLVSAVSASRNRFDRQIKEGQANMEVSGIGSVSGATPIRPAAAPAIANPSVSAPKDELEISAAGKMLDQLSETPEVRAERIALIKEAIDAGVYDTDEKLEAALSKMFDSMGIAFDDD